MKLYPNDSRISDRSQYHRDMMQAAQGAYTVELVNGGKTIEKGKLIVQ